MRCCKHTGPGLWGVTCIFCQRTDPCALVVNHKQSVFQLPLHHLRSAKVRSILNDLLDSLLADLLTS